MRKSKCSRIKTYYNEQNKREKDEFKASLMVISWMLGFCLGLFISGTSGLIIILLVTAMCGIYAKYDAERDSREREQHWKEEQYRARMQDIERWY